MQKLKKQLIAFALSLASLITASVPAFAAQTTVTPGVDWSGGASGFGANIGTNLGSFGGASVRGTATVLTGPDSTTFGLGADAIGHEDGVFFGAGANVLFPTCGGCSAAFDPDILAGVHLVGNLALEARYYISTRSDTSGIFFTGLQFAL
jgi:hypothetical protein